MTELRKEAIKLLALAGLLCMHFVKMLPNFEKYDLQSI